MKPLKILRIKQLLLFFALLFCITGCDFRTTKTVSTDSESIITEIRSIQVIDITKNPTKTKKYSDIVADKYIPLETNRETLVDRSGKLIYVSDTRIVVSNSRLGDIFVFDGEGKIIYSFNHKGQGSKEYLVYSFNPIAYDEKEKEIFYFDNPRKRCLVYSESGNFIRSFYFNNNSEYSEVYSYNEASLLVYNKKYNQVDSAYLFISKQNGNILGTIHLPQSNFRHLAAEKEKIEDGLHVVYNIDYQTLFKNGDEFYISEFTSDTVYKFTNDKQLVPVFAKAPPYDRERTPMPFFQIIKPTDTFIMALQYDTKFNDWPKQPEVSRPKIVMFEIANEQFFECLLNFRFVITNSSVDFQKNQYAVFWGADKILKQCADGDCDEKLKEIARKLKEDDNPVVTVINF